MPIFTGCVYFSWHRHSWLAWRHQLAHFILGGCPRKASTHTARALGGDIMKLASKMGVSSAKESLPPNMQLSRLPSEWLVPQASSAKGVALYLFCYLCSNVKHRHAQSPPGKIYTTPSHPHQRPEGIFPLTWRHVPLNSKACASWAVGVLCNVINGEPLLALKPNYTCNQTTGLLLLFIKCLRSMLVDWKYFDHAVLQLKQLFRLHRYHLAMHYKSLAIINM